MKLTRGVTEEVGGEGGHGTYQGCNRGSLG